MIGNDFQPETMERLWQCSECRKEFLKGTIALVSRKLGKVKKRVCSEECRKTFDFNYWWAKADARDAENGQRSSTQLEWEDVYLSDYKQGQR